MVSGLSTKEFAVKLSPANGEINISLASKMCGVSKEKMLEIVAKNSTSAGGRRRAVKNICGIILSLRGALSSEESIPGWLRRAHPMLDGETPLRAMEDGLAGAVVDMLHNTEQFIPN